MIEVKGLKKSFGNKRILHEIDLKADSGECVTVFGPNGAGKSTLVHILAGIMRPTEGHIWIEGYNIKENPDCARRSIGLVSHRPLVYGELTPVENLTFYGRMFEIPDVTRRIDEILRHVGLELRAHDPVRTLSRGMIQRLAIARALLHGPSVLLLDEPFTGLDQQAVDMFYKIVTGTNKSGGTVIMTTHNLERGLEICHRAVILTSGRFVFEAKKHDLNKTEFKTTFSHYMGGAER